MHARHQNDRLNGSELVSAMSGELRRAVQRRTWRSCVVLIASDRRAAIGHLQAIASSIGCRPFTVPRRRRSWDILHQARQELLIAGRWVTGHLSSAILRFPRRVLPAGGGRTSTTALTGPWPAEHRSLLRIRTAQGQRALFFCRPEGVRGPVSALLGRRACRHVAVFSVHRRRRAGRHRRRRGQRGCAAHLCAVLERLGGRPGAAPPPRRRRRLVLSGDRITSVVRRRSAARRHSARHRIGQATHLAERRRVLVPVRSLEAPWPEIAAPPSTDVSVPPGSSPSLAGRAPPSALAPRFAQRRLREWAMGEPARCAGPVNGWLPGLGTPGSCPLRRIAAASAAGRKAVRAETLAGECDKHVSVCTASDRVSHSQKVDSHRYIPVDVCTLRYV